MRHTRGGGPSITKSGEKKLKFLSRSRWGGPVYCAGDGGKKTRKEGY